MLQKFIEYNQPEKHGHKLPTFSAKVIKSPGSTVQQLALQLWLQKPAYADMRIAVEQFGDALTKYGAFVDRELAVMKKNHAQREPVRRMEDSQEIAIHQPLGVVEPRHAKTYGKLVQAPTTANFYQPVFVGDYDKVANVTQRTYRANLHKAMPYKVVQLTYSAGNCKGDHIFLCGKSTLLMMKKPC